MITRAERLSWRIFLIVAALAFGWLVLRPLMAPLVLAVLLAVIAHPVHRRIEARLGAGSAPAALTSMSMLIVSLGIPAVGIGLLFTLQMRSVLAELLTGVGGRSRLGEILDLALGWLSRFGERLLGQRPDMEALGDVAVRHLAGSLYQNLPDLVGLAGRLTLDAGVLVLVLFVLLYRGGVLLELGIELSPLPVGHVRQVLHRLEVTIQGVFLGTLATALFQGLVAGIGFWLTGFQNFVVWGALTAGASLIPFVGTALIWVPAVIYLLVIGQTGTGALLLLFGIAISTVDNLLRALVIHDRTTVHPVLIFLALVGALQTVGPMGLIYGPLIAACVTEVARLYRGESEPLSKDPADQELAVTETP